MKNSFCLRASFLRATPRFENTLETMKAQIAALTAERDAARAEVAQHQVTVTAVTGERDAARTEVTTAQGQLATANETITAHAATISTQAAEIVTLKANATTVEKKAAQLLASQGHAPLALGGTESPTGEKPKSLIEQYNALTDVNERAAFYAKHFAGK